jgi:hypothetical protein
LAEVNHPCRVPELSLVQPQQLKVMTIISKKESQVLYKGNLPC